MRPNSRFVKLAEGLMIGKLFPLLLAANFALSPAIADDLLDTADRSGSFKTFLDAVKTAGLTHQLKARGPYTIFMPTDTAFQQVDETEWEAVKKHPDKLARVIRYHMIPGKVKVTEVKPGPALSDEGETLQLKSDNGMVTVNGARVTDSDLIADNGIIHGIDHLLLPPD
jgi:uncharacterized surface protein with fasciclin (FAS1) repeats